MRRGLWITSLLAGVLAFGSMPAHADTYADNDVQERRDGTQVQRDARGLQHGGREYGRSGGQRGSHGGKWSADRRNRRGGQQDAMHRGGKGSCQSNRAGGGDRRNHGGNRQWDKTQRNHRDMQGTDGNRDRGQRNPDQQRDNDKSED